MHIVLRKLLRTEFMPRVLSFVTLLKSKNNRTLFISSQCCRSFCTPVEYILPKSDKETFAEREYKNRFDQHTAELRKRKVFIGNLSHRATEDDLYAHLQSAGDITQISVMRKSDGTSKRCALVEFDTYHSAERAVSLFDKSVMCDKAIAVRPDFYNKKERRQRDRSMDVETKSHALVPPPSPRQSRWGLRALVSNNHSVFVGNLPISVDSSALRAHFESAGFGVVFAQVFMTGHWPPRSKQCGKITFSEGTSVPSVITSLNGSDLDGRPIIVKEDEGRQESRRQESDHRDSNSRQSDRDGGVSRFLTRHVRWNAEEKALELVDLDEDSSNINPARSIYVSNLAFSVTHKRLAQFLVDDLIMSDRRMELAVLKVKRIHFMLDAVGQSKGRAFVEFDHELSAMEAVQRVDRTELQGRRVFARMMSAQ